jgi:hypothetical protein
MATNYSFSKLAGALINIFETRDKELNDEKITVNDLVSKVAFWYEKLRTAMDYGSEETIPRRAIERMLKRMLFLEQDAKLLAKDLVRELIWAGYFPNATVPESIINRVATSINLYLNLKNKVLENKTNLNEDLNEIIIQLLSCEIFFTLIPNKDKEAVSNFMFQILKDSVIIEDDSEQTRNIQVFIAVRKSFARDDLAFLRYKLFKQIFGSLTEANFNRVVTGFEDGFKEIKNQLSYPKKERILNQIKKETPPFLILFDILTQEKNNIRNIVKDEVVLKQKVFTACSRRYKSINRKVRTAIIRSFIFILFTKAIMALGVEGLFESIFLGKIQWGSIVLNTVLPPMIMIGVGIGIRTPNQQNSEFIFADIKKLLFEDKPLLSNTLTLKLKGGNTPTVKDYVFYVLWLLSTGLTFGIIWLALGKLHFNLLSKGIFIFFIAIISFLSYRIYQTANSYTVIKKANLFSPLFDFFFVPVIRVGRKLTEGIAQINFILLIVDFIIEAPFKGLIGFFEQWFLFVATKREELE